MIIIVVPVILAISGIGFYVKKKKEKRNQQQNTPRFTPANNSNIELTAQSEEVYEIDAFEISGSDIPGIENLRKNHKIKSPTMKKNTASTTPGTEKNQPRQRVLSMGVDHKTSGKIIPHSRNSIVTPPLYFLPNRQASTSWTEKRIDGCGNDKIWNEQFQISRNLNYTDFRALKLKAASGESNDVKKLIVLNRSRSLSPSGMSEEDKSEMLSQYKLAHKKQLASIKERLKTQHLERLKKEIAMNLEQIRIAKAALAMRLKRQRKL